MNKGHALLFYGLVLVWLVVTGCKSFEEQKNALPDTKDRGFIHVSADESFKPIIDAMVQVYESNRPDTRINVQYKPEAECLKDFATDSIRVIIATRGFSESEKNFMVDSMKVSPERMTIARDAIAVIVHPKAADSLFTMEEIKDVLTGRFKKKLIPVFDGTNATSTVRFIIDSVLKSEKLTADAVAARTSEGVIDYVAKNQAAVGFIGVSWIGNKEDSTQISFLTKVKMAHLESTDLEGYFVLPVQANIYMKRYPMVRDLVYIVKENHKGLGHGFVDFMSGEIGQLIFKRAYLVPAKKDFRIRPARLRE